MNSALPASALDLLLDEFVDRVADRVVHRLEAREPGPVTELLSLTEAAEVLRCTPQRIYQLRSTGRLPRTVEGGRAIVRRSDLERLIEEDSA